jgi:multidrug resistance efflux pump
MKKIVFILAIFASTFIYAENKPTSILINNKPPVAKVASYLEGIVNMHVTAGEYVKKGQLLFTLNEDDLQIDKKKYKLAVWYYKNIYNRSKKLYSKKALALEEYEEHEQNYLKALLDIKTNKLMLDRSIYHAPFNGVVTKIIHYTGSAVGDGDDVLEITKIKKLHPEAKLKYQHPVAEVASYIEGMVTMQVTQNQQVKKGQLLFSVDPDFSEILIEKNNIDLWFYKEKYERTQKLYKNHVASLEVYETDKYNYINSSLNLESLKVNIKRSKYYAPFDGVVTKIIHYTGSAVGDGNNVLYVKKC